MASPLILEVIELLKNTGASLSLAESCTGGLLSSQFVRLSGVSEVYRGGIISYDNEVKIQVLGIAKPLLVTNGAVSRPVAREMARSAKRLMASTWAASITGVAGPGGGTSEKPVGTVCFGICGPVVEYTEQALFHGNREQIQDQSVEFALKLLRDSLGRQKVL